MLKPLFAASLLALATPAIADSLTLYRADGTSYTCERMPSDGAYCEPPTTTPAAVVINPDFQRLLHRIKTSTLHSQPRRALPQVTIASASEPIVDLPYDASPGDYLERALTAIQAQDGATADEALQRATTRLLDRSVELGATETAARGRNITALHKARMAVEARDWEQAADLVGRVVEHRVVRRQVASERPVNYP